MRILVTCYFRYPHVGGLATYMHQLIQGLTRLGHDVDVFAEHPDGTGYYLQQTNQFVHHDSTRPPVADKVMHGYQRILEHIPSWMAGQEIAKYACEMAAVQLLDLPRYDIIHAQEVVSANVMSRIKPKYTPLVATLHGCATWDELRYLETITRVDDFGHEYLRAREHYGAIAADKTIVPSQWLKDLLKSEFHVPSDQMTVIPYGFDVDPFIRRTEEPFSLKLPRSKKLIFCHARLDRVKGHKYLFDALAQLKHRQDWQCCVAGDGDNREALLRQATELGLNDRVSFLGVRNDVPSLLRQADIVALASLSENLPYVVGEAQVAGTAVVATAVGGIPEIIRHEETGLLCPASDSTALAANIERLLEDNQLRSRIRKNAREWGVHFWSRERLLGDTVAVYNSAFKEQKHSIPDELFLHVVASHSKG